MTKPPPSDTQAGTASLSPAEAGGAHTVGDCEWRPWDTAPRDGTAFCVGTFVRFNRFAECWEVLVVREGKRKWAGARFPHEPTAWITPPGSADPPPNPDWFAVAYRVCLVRRQSLFMRLLGNLWRMQ